MKYLPSLFFILLLTACNPDPPTDYTLIHGATLIDLDDLGRSSVDIPNAYVLFSEGQIVEVGEYSEDLEVPRGTDRIDATGKYLLPGLIDGFAAINNQSYCNAYLYMGVTSILAVDGGRRGEFFGEGAPSPDIYRLEGVGRAKISTPEMLAQIDSLSGQGYEVLLLMYGLLPGQIDTALQRAEELDMATIGELGYTTYEEGMELGFDAFVHTTRYSLDVAPRDMASAVADAPFSNDLNSPKWQYYKYLTSLSTDDEALIQHAQNLGRSETFIMPTSSLSYLDIPGHGNPWEEPVAVILNIDDINRPADPATGMHSIDSVEQAAYTNLILNELSAIEPAYYRHGARYLAGSGTDVWGTMPGISLHTELEILHTRIGLSRREAIAAATTNFAEAFGWKVGRIETGYAAHLLLLNQNPLDDLQHLKDIHQLFLNGEEVDRAALLSLD